jgi:hypothetical protein
MMDGHYYIFQNYSSLHTGTSLLLVPVDDVLITTPVNT